MLSSGRDANISSDGRIGHRPTRHVDANEVGHRLVFVQRLFRRLLGPAVPLLTHYMQSIFGTPGVADPSAWLRGYEEPAVAASRDHGTIGRFSTPERCAIRRHRACAPRGMQSVGTFEVPTSSDDT